MAGIKLTTSERVIPMIYAYSTPEVPIHDGWVKVGYTEKQSVEDRIKQQTHTVGITAKEEWRGTATFDDGSGDTFTDHELHAYFKKLGIERQDGTEWFHMDGSTSKRHYHDFRENRGILSDTRAIIPYQLRDEQEEAVELTAAYRQGNENGEFLWNAKPRFGKTLSVYDFIKRIDATNVLVVTNRPAIANSWYSDYEKFLGRESGYFFVSHVEGIKDMPLVVTYDDYDRTVKGNPTDHRYKMIYFASLQDLKGSVSFGGQYYKRREVASITWDVLVIDEAHEGVDTYKTDTAFRHIKRDFTLHLSGTPFKMLADDKFPDNAIFNWTYADEQAKKDNWDDSKEQENPYGMLPKLNMFTYQMSEIVRDEISQGVEINGETEEYAFDLNEFFSTNGNGSFVYNSSVDKFLDALTTQDKFPFSTDELRGEMKHTLWLLNRVDSAKALARKLGSHPVFKDYEVILAAGDGRVDDDYENEKSFNKVVKAISEHEKTITLSVGQLTTGVTIPEWAGVLMLSNVKSPALYMQAAFRAQNPYKYVKDGKVYRKQNAYVFDFDPARTLVIYDKFANDLLSGSGNISGEDRRENITRLLNFFPVLAEDDEGEMVSIDAEKVLSIPRKIKSVEVVRRGFMSNYLFQNIGNIFGAPAEFMEIINQFEAVSEPTGKVSIDPDIAENAEIGANGDVAIDGNFVIGRTQDVFGDKIYGVEEKEIASEIALFEVGSKTAEEEQIRRLKDIITKTAIEPLLSDAKESYGEDISSRDSRRLESVLSNESESIVHNAVGDYKIKTNLLEQEKMEALSQCSASEAEEVEKQFDQRQAEIVDELKEQLSSQISDFVNKSKEIVVNTVETSKKEKEVHKVQDDVRDHLRGFSRTIPSFLMAYGDDTVTLYTFDSNIPDAVFKEVTSVTLDQFRLLRDGYDYKDPETGEVKHHAGFFDEVVFDDSVKEFLRLRKALADYFDEAAKEDIFDYIPPQKTNQIFTPKKVVAQMVNMLEEENPGCFDMPEKTFIDLYMKSGLYITEIVKRLYNSPKLKQLYPDKYDRLKHIFKEQVYGLAPTEIIYKIATNYILGFDEDVVIEEHNFRQADALPYAKEGKIQELLDELYGGGVSEE